MIVDAEDVKKNPASDIHVKRFEAKEIEGQKVNSQLFLFCENGSLRQEELPDHSHSPSATNAEGNFWQMSDPQREDDRA